ncbi:MAG: cobalt ECF transporter T component CbiQ [Methanoregula sp.]|jgi:cobalt/nickel transport system permease protein|uniref:cobalt ECF transporter T component CbiQ n=1 Tax=Methanoregula sp. TaxID=2052170 RepID=UPI0025EDBB05|nr:cobalt ECF transporter T component CbiQ [Methanoregula sp.]MCK9630445.1 cobalt ECF transporter T component CbiQ [Methanoregula sp.]
MFEELLEDVAQNNGLREVNTTVKLAVGLGAIVLCLLSTSYLSPLFIALVLSAAILLLARIDIKTYAELFLVPLWFAFLSAIVIVLISGGEHIFWSWNPLSFLSLSITRESINTGFFIFCRVIGGMSALLFIALTTPMTDLFAVMRKACVPDFVIDLAMIIYRTIFILMDQVRQIYHAQVMRLGYSTWRESITTFASMCGAAFIASWDEGDDLIRAMDARCYDGKFALMGESRPAGFRSVAALCLFIASGSAAVYVSQGMTLL